MMEESDENNIRLSGSDVQVGVAMPWDTYDAAGRLLLRKGIIINSANQLRALLERGMYRHGVLHDAPPVVEEQPLNPFVVLGELLHRTVGLLRAIEQGQAEHAVTRITKICGEVQQLCDYDADAVLAAMHLDREGPYSISHSLCCAIITELIARRLGMDQESKSRAFSAALTANVGMLELQDQLQSYKGPLSDEIRGQINRHPMCSVDLLKAAGVADEKWLAIVEQHHERDDGRGYPRKLSGAAILKEAHIIGAVDRYHAMISDREGRQALAPTSSLRMMYARMEGLNEVCVLALIKELGVYPPGMYVRLFNGEIGVVTRRGEDGITPQVASLVGPRGAPYMKPFVRDCNTSEYAIKEMVDALNIPVSNLYKLWGYGNS